MRHVLVRSLGGLIWLVAAIVSGVSAEPEMAAFYGVIGGVFLYFAYAAWKKEKNSRGGK